jgi:hypothetical protein
MMEKANTYYVELEEMMKETILEYAVCPICQRLNYFFIVDNELGGEGTCRHHVMSEKGDMLFEQDGS